MLWGIASSLGISLAVEELTIDAVNKALQKKDVRLKRIVSDIELNVPRPEGIQKGTEWTTAICKKLDATAYLHGGTAQSGYMDTTYYKRYGIKLIVQDWMCPEYTQQYMKKGFVNNLSILDLLLNEDQATVQETLGIV
jgi:hypothetical protein